MKVLREFPQLTEKFVVGRLKLCQLEEAWSLFNRIRPTAQAKLEILSEIEGATVAKTRIILAQHGPPDVREESEEYRVKDGLRLSLRLDQELVDQWSEIEIYLGRKLTRIELLKEITAIALKAVKKDALRNRCRNRKCRGVSKAQRREVLHRAGHRCEYVAPDGKRCEARHHLQIDHILALGKGGLNDLDNLQVLCPAHNRLKAVDDFGRDKMKQYIPSLH